MQSHMPRRIDRHASENNGSAKLHSERDSSSDNIGSAGYKTLDANEAVARIAYAVNEVIAIYPITPASPMGEWTDAWSANGVKNLWGTVPSVVETQSEGGAAGAVHGALQTGALSCTFTSSQGLLLMIPNMYKIAGELTPAVFHIAARSLAAQALSIFGDHSDVMAARATGWAMLCAASVQEAQDFALIAHAATLEARIPFLHFFDGFRTSHEISKIDIVHDDVLRAMIDENQVIEHRARALSPDHPVIRGTAQNPDVYFQARESVNPFYATCPQRVQNAMDHFAELTGRRYGLFEYHGANDADRVIVLMGSGCEAVHETVDFLNGRGEKVGVLKVRLYRPFDAKAFAKKLPETIRDIAVLDRTKEPGAMGEPLYLDCVNALYEEGRSGGVRVVGGRYGLSSKEFTPAMIKAVFDNLAQTSPKNHFTVGIDDDLSHTSLDFDRSFSIEPADVVRAQFFGLGADGTVGANKESIKIIGENTNNFVQGYFVYDSKKAGAATISHLRFGPRPIKSTYLISKAQFIACHQPFLLQTFDVLKDLASAGTFLLNSPFDRQKVWQHLPQNVQHRLVELRARFFVIDASKVARESGMGGRINTVMQTCFFAISGVLPPQEAIAAIKNSIRKTYAKKGEEVVEMNLHAVDQTLAQLYEVEIPKTPVPSGGNGQLKNAPEFVRNVLGEIMAGRGDHVPVSALPNDGTFPTGTTQFEKRNLAAEVPVWEPEVCIQCGKCVLVCPHAVIRSKVYEAAVLEEAPATFKTHSARLPEWKGLQYTLQVAVEDCTGCGICVDVCPARNKSEARLKAINMRPQLPLRQNERANWNFFLSIPDFDRTKIENKNVREMQVRQPLFEFSSACAGCGETPYIKLLTQLFGDRLIIANATGCSSIYGGNLPTTPYTKDRNARGPAWSNSLFEDTAEFGLGFRVSLDKQQEFAGELLQRLSPEVGRHLAIEILNARQRDEADIAEQRERVENLKRRLESLNEPAAKRLLAVADTLVRKSVWIIGGDGWGYDIGFGGLDHVLASGRNVKVLLLDTEVYSNTGGQCSKSTPRAAVAKFASGGKRGPKKDLGLMAMTYGNIYVASVAMGAKDEHTLKAFLEAEAYDGPALIIAYSHCIAHGINMTTAMQNQKAAVNCGQWLLYRYNPERAVLGENPLHLDGPAPHLRVADYFKLENRFKMLEKSDPRAARELLNQAQADVKTRRVFYEFLATQQFSPSPNA